MFKTYVKKNLKLTAWLIKYTPIKNLKNILKSHYCMKLKMTLDKWKNSLWKDIQDVLLSEINKKQNSMSRILLIT